MAELEAERRLPARAAAVFDVVRDETRLPEWLSTVSSTEPAGPDAVRVEGEAHGSAYTDEGFWRPRPEQLRVEWGSMSRDGQPAEYAGWVQVEHAGDGCSVLAHLSFTGSRDDDHAGAAGDEAQRELEESLRRLEGLVSGGAG